jgi:tRNA/tmRNA/rRNA uracil-C5-methylase (TrmA/RlmC/RlmD family)
LILILDPVCFVSPHLRFSTCALAANAKLNNTTGCAFVVASAEAILEYNVQDLSRDLVCDPSRKAVRPNF